MLPKINIVVYTDCQSMFNENPASPKGSLSNLEAFTKLKTQALAHVCFTFVNRHPADPTTGTEIHAGNKITDELMKTADELWVFGRRKINNQNEPNNELDDAEVAVLRNWMNGEKKGGVFVTGDHSEPDETLPNPSCDKGDHATFLSLGRALGHRIPRANQLRDWKGPPTFCNEVFPLEDRDNFNTQEGSDPCALDDALLQSDSIPQTIILTEKKCVPHRLFWYPYPKNELHFINKLPDHLHEGQAVAPDELNEDFPVHSLPPEIIAKGRDKRFPEEKRLGGLLTAFDGDSAEIGRIVADSSFHHYLDHNLREIPARDSTGFPQPGSDLDQIAQLYGNLALWLAPKSIRDKIKFDLLLGLSRHPDVLETRGSSLLTVGKVAHGTLRSTLGTAKLRWLFASSEFEQRDPMDEFFALIFLDEKNASSISPLIRPELPLGAVIVACQLYLKKQRIADITKFADSAKLIDVLRQRLTDVLQSNEKAVQNVMAGL